MMDNKEAEAKSPIDASVEKFQTPPSNQPTQLFAKVKNFLLEDKFVLVGVLIVAGIIVVGVIALVVSALGSGSNSGATQTSIPVYTPPDTTSQVDFSSQGSSPSAAAPASASASPSPSSSPSPSPTATPSPTPTATPSPSASPSPTPAATPSPTPSPS